MQIIELVPECFDVWRQKIGFLIKETILYNFGGSIVPDSYYEQTLDGLKNHLSSGDAKVFLATEKSELLGWAWCYTIQRFDKKRLHIGNFATMPQYRGSGVGRKIFAEVEKFARESEYDGLDLMVTESNTDAVKFYMQNDFTVERFLMKKDLK